MAKKRGITRNISTLIALIVINKNGLKNSDLRQTIARLVQQDILNRNRKRLHLIRGIIMKSRWQKSLEAAVAEYDTPMPWARGDVRNAMIARRRAKAEEQVSPSRVQARSA